MDDLAGITGAVEVMSSLMDRRRHSLSSLHALATFPKPWTVEPMLSGYRVIDDNGIVQYRSVDLEKYVGKSAGALATALSGTADSAMDVAGLDGIENKIKA